MRKRKKVLLRNNRREIWKEGISKAYGKEPTENEMHSFNAGFNMGYKAHKMKILK